MSDITGEEIEELLKKSWNDFFEHYDSEVKRYRETPNMKPAEAFEEHWMVWNEHDLMFQLGRSLYEKLQVCKQLQGNAYQNIELHFNKPLGISTFEDLTLKKKLKKLKEKRLEKGLKGVPKPDLIIADEIKLDRFLLCAEAKFFHYSVARYKREPHTVIKNDIDTLVAIKDLEIADRVVFMLFDDYYCHREPEKHKKIENTLAEAVAKHNGKEHKLTILKYP